MDVAEKSGKVHEVTMENFEDTVDQHPVVILDFWAAWCQPCKVFAPAFKMMAELHPDVFFGSVNTEVATELAQAFQVRSIPTLMAFKNGDLVFEQPGVLQLEQFDQLVHQLKASNSTR
jgi:thioredoxin